MSREPRRDALRQSYDRAVARYNAQSRDSLVEVLRHSGTVDSSVIRFGEQIRASSTPMAVVKARMEAKRSDWSSGSSHARKSFNTLFLRELQECSIATFKEVVHQAFGVRFLPDGDVVLYRGDSRKPADVLSKGFKLKYAVDHHLNKRLSYTGYTKTVANELNEDIRTFDQGVSTSEDKSYADRYRSRGATYKIHFKAGALDRLGLLGLDVVASWPGRDGNLRYAREKKEINFLSDIPPECIESYQCAGYGWRSNPGYTGGVPVPEAKPAPATHRLVPKPSVSASESVPSQRLAVAASAQPTTRPAGMRHTPALAASRLVVGYGVDAKVHLHSYHCDIRVYKGQKNRFHLVFDDATAAQEFINGEHLRSERNPSKPKGYDSKRYPGLFAVRTNLKDYNAARARHSELPLSDAVKSAPAFK